MFLKEGDWTEMKGRKSRQGRVEKTERGQHGRNNDEKRKEAYV